MVRVEFGGFYLIFIFQFPSLRSNILKWLPVPENTVGLLRFSRSIVLGYFSWGILIVVHSVHSMTPLSSSEFDLWSTI